MSLYRGIQDAVRDRILTHDYIADTGGLPPKPVTVLSNRRGAIPARIHKAVAKLGVVVVVAEPTVARGADANERVVSVPVVIAENEAMKPKQPGFDVGEAIMDHLDEWQPKPGDVDFLSALEFQSFTPVAAPVVEGFNDVTAWDQFYVLRFLKG